MKFIAQGQGEENTLLELKRAGAMEGGLPDRSYGCRGMQPLLELQEIPQTPLSFYPQISCQSQLGARGQERLGDAATVVMLPGCRE